MSINDAIHLKQRRLRDFFQKNRLVVELLQDNQIKQMRFSTLKHLNALRSVS